MASGNKADFHQFDPGINGKQFDRTHGDTKNVKRIDKSWPVDEFGAKLSLGPNYGSLLESMGSGDIEMKTDGEPIDPPRRVPSPGTREFGEQARERRERLRKEREEEFRPYDPNDAEAQDIVSGKKTRLKERRQELEDFGNF